MRRKALSVFESIIKQIIIFHYWFQNEIINVLVLLLFNNKKLKLAKSILIFRTGSLGDSVCALPAIFSIQKNFPESKIDILTNKGNSDLVGIKDIMDRNIISEIIDYSSLNKKELLVKLKQNQYDLFIQLPQYDASLLRQIRDIIFAKIVGVISAFGWQVASTRFLARYQARLKTFINERDRLLKILEQNGLTNFGLQFPFDSLPEMKKKVLNILRENDLTKKEDNVAFIVGAKRTQNRWPIEYFSDIAKYLVKNNKTIIGIGDDNDRDLFDRIGMNASMYNFCGKLSPLETAELLKHCSLTLSNDTGPMHLSYAVGTPTVAIFCGRDYPNKWFPPNENNITISNKNKYCHGCWNKECDFRNHCMIQIIPDKVYSKILSNYDLVS